MPGGTLELGESVVVCLEREFQEECQLDIKVGNLIGCLECHWPEKAIIHQEFNMIFEVKASVASLPETVRSVEPHISFAWLSVSDVLNGQYAILPAEAISFLQKDDTAKNYIFENQLKS